MIKLALFGDPVSHSVSPAIHQAFAQQFALSVSYQRILAPPDLFFARWHEFVQAGGVGANITVPLKELACKIPEQLEAPAQISGALNTLIKKEQMWVGTNTDGLGLVQDLLRLNYPLKNARLLMLGAGGAARGVLPALIEAGVAHIHIANRTEQRAVELVKVFKNTSLPKIPISVSCLEQIPRQPYQIIINATSAGLNNHKLLLSEKVFEAQPACYDMVYGTKPTLFTQTALQNNCQAAEGLGMLVGQAAISFKYWTGNMPRITPVIEEIRQKQALWSSEDAV